jgi:hypothetical protein
MIKSEIWHEKSTFSFIELYRFWGKIKCYICKEQKKANVTGALTWGKVIEYIKEAEKKLGFIISTRGFHWQILNREVTWLYLELQILFARLCE